MPRAVRSDGAEQRRLRHTCQLSKPRKQTNYIQINELSWFHQVLRIRLIWYGFGSDLKYKKYQLFLLITQKNIYYYLNIKNINSTDKNPIYDFFNVSKVKK